ncbi:MAG: DUF4173 domain-containing protein [Lachnospiraceae bacterium]|nr:DUF4173 domain-containing protein [Lachnospiraceae bacterium]
METSTETNIGTGMETNIENKHMEINQTAIQMYYERNTKYTEMVNHFFPFGIGCLLYGILFTISLYKGFHGITMPILAVVTGVGIIGAVKKLGITIKKQSIFYILGIVLLGISSCLTGDGYLIFFNVCGIILLIFSWLLSAFCDTSKWGFPKYLKELINAVFIPIGYLNGFFKSLFNYFSDKEEEEKSSKTKYVWLGILLGIPFVMVVTALLVSADAVFGNMFKNVFEKIRLPENPIWLFFLLVCGIIGSFAVLGYFADEKIKEETKEERNWEPLLAITFLSLSTVIYLVFSVVQILYLFIGGFQLPDGYTYATYAHEGFYQLLAVCLINLIVLFVCIGKFRDNLILKIILTVFSACTYIMLSSSVFRMILYIQVYQMTYLRLMTLWGLLVIGIVLLGCVITIWKNSFCLFQYAMIVVTVLYISLSLARPGYLIAKYNLADKKADVDIHYLLNLGTDAIPTYLESAQFEKNYLENKEEYDAYLKANGEIYNDHKIDQDGSYIKRPWVYEKMRKYQEINTEMGILDFNFSYYKAGKKIQEKMGLIL